MSTNRIVCPECRQVTWMVAENRCIACGASAPTGSGNPDRLRLVRRARETARQLRGQRHSPDVPVEPLGYAELFEELATALSPSRETDR